MKKLCLILVFLICAMPLAIAQTQQMQSPDWVEVAVSGTQYCVLVPADWQTTTGTDAARALVESIAVAGNCKLLVFYSTYGQGTLDDWKQALVRGSKHNNGVKNISEQMVEDRRFVVYNLQYDDFTSFCAATQVDTGVFVTLEFRVLDGTTPEQAFGDLIGDILTSLQPVEQ